MEKKWIILFGVIAATAILVYLLILQKNQQTISPTVQAAIGQSTTVTLSNNSPTNSATLNIPYDDTITINISISNGQPNSSYTVSLSTGTSTTISTDSSGSGSGSLSINNVTSNGSVNLTIQGPGISSSFTLTINLNIAYNPVLTVSVNGSSYTLNNNSTSASASISGSSTTVNFNLSNAVPNTSYELRISTTYVSYNGTLTTPSINTTTITTNSSGSASFSQGVSVPGGYAGVKVTYTLQGPGIATEYSFTLVLTSPINPTTTIVISY